MFISLQILAKTFVSNIIMDLSYLLSKYILLEVFENCLKCVVYIKLLKFLRILITAVYFQDRNWISKTMYCISCSVICKIVLCSEFPDIRDNAGNVTRRRRTQATAKCYAFDSKRDDGPKTDSCFSIIMFFHLKGPVAVDLQNNIWVALAIYYFCHTFAI